MPTVLKTSSDSVATIMLIMRGTGDTSGPSGQYQLTPDWALWRVKGSSCQVCRRSILWFDANWDAEYCPICDEWRRDPCGDPHCEYCSRRPERPGLVHSVAPKQPLRPLRPRWPPD
jgi:hypothetical protein